MHALRPAQARPASAHHVSYPWAKAFRDEWEIIASAATRLPPVLGVVSRAVSRTASRTASAFPNSLSAWLPKSVSPSFHP